MLNSESLKQAGYFKIWYLKFTNEQIIFIFYNLLQNFKVVGKIYFENV